MFNPLPADFIFGATGTQRRQPHSQPFGNDITHMSGLGLSSYRIRVPWSGLDAGTFDHYDRFIDQLLGAGIEPAVTIDHEDLPEDLRQQGSWQQRQTAQRFGDLVHVLAHRIGDRIAYWWPLTSPARPRLSAGVLTPEESAVTHHQLLGHGFAVAALRSQGAASVGGSNHFSPIWATDSSTAAQQAASAYADAHNFGVADAMLIGRYPESVADQFPIRPGDMSTISAPLDGYSISYCCPTLVRSGSPAVVETITGYPTTETGAPVVPHGLLEALSTMDVRYRQLPSIHVETGCAHSALNDTFRVNFLKAHLDVIAKAIAEGIPVVGYWCRSLVDQLDPAGQPAPRCGLVHVDHASQVRTPRASYHWLAQRIMAHRRGYRR